MKLYFYTYDTMMKAPSEFQNDRAKIGVNVKIIIFASIFAIFDNNHAETHWIDQIYQLTNF